MSVWSDLRIRPDTEALDARFNLAKASGRIGVTFLGVSTLLIDDGESRVLIDGCFSRPSLLAVLTRKLKADHAHVDE